MAVRGSGIGAGMMAGGIGLSSTRSGSAQGVYGMGTAPTGAKVQTHTMLLVLVFAELFALIWLKYAFRHHQGG
jgi:hypothetical protein